MAMDTDRDSQVAALVPTPPHCNARQRTSQIIPLITVTVGDFTQTLLPIASIRLY